MKIGIKILGVVVLWLTSTIWLFSQQYTLTSPSGNISATINVEESISLSATLKGKDLFTLDNLAMEVAEDSKLFQVGKIKKEHRETIEAMYKPIVPIKTAEVSDKCNLLRLEFKKHAIEFRAYDEGIAYRFVGDLDKEVTVKGESMAINFADGTMVWFPEEESHFSHNERYYKHEKAESFSPGQFCSLSMLAVPNGVNVL
ncbi:MAG: hypothetical protein DWQ02_14180, partial [Bacteroidetes bacterium]